MKTMCSIKQIRGLVKERNEATKLLKSTLNYLTGECPINEYEYEPQLISLIQEHLKKYN